MVQVGVVGCKSTSKAKQTKMPPKNTVRKVEMDWTAFRSRVGVLKVVGGRGGIFGRTKCSLLNGCCAIPSFKLTIPERAEESDR